MKRRTIEERYQEHYRKERKILEDYAAHETEWADDLLLWYKARKQEIPDDEYRGVVFFKNREYENKPGSLTLLYSMYQRMLDELPPPTREIAFDLAAYRYKVYSITLAKGGFDG